MPLSANLFRLESSILTQAKRATNRNNVATEKLGIFFFFYRGISVGGILSGNPPGATTKHPHSRYWLTSSHEGVGVFPVPATPCVARNGWMVGAGRWDLGVRFPPFLNIGKQKRKVFFGKIKFFEKKLGSKFEKKNEMR